VNTPFCEAAKNIKREKTATTTASEREKNIMAIVVLAKPVGAEERLIISLE
jgi:hypothetical protein